MKIRGLGDTTVVTAHFNPCGYSRLDETYYEWMPTLPQTIRDKVICYEAIFDDDLPRIKDSVVIRGTRANNLMFQKEFLLQKALEECTTKYFCWLDHDLVYGPQAGNWILKGLNRLSDNIKAVQLFRQVQYVNSDDTKIFGVSMLCGGFAPGGAWVATTEYLREIGGFPLDHILGSGDKAMFFKMKDHSDYLPLICFHIWHGDIVDRDYSNRYRPLEALGFDASTDIGVQENGLGYWVNKDPALIGVVKDYFVNRKEDGK